MCCMCKYNGKKLNFIFENKEYCSQCLIDEFAKIGIIVQMTKVDDKLRITI